MTTYPYTRIITVNGRAQQPAPLGDRPSDAERKAYSIAHTTWLMDDHGNYVSWIHEDFRRDNFRHGNRDVLGLPGMDLYEAIAHEGDTACIIASWPDLVIVARPSSRGPIRPGWLPGVEYAAKVMPDGRVLAILCREMYERDWRGVKCINPYKGSQ